MLVMCSTGIRPSEAKNLRWRDVAIRTDKEGRKFVVLHVRGKDKYRNLVAAGNVAVRGHENSIAAIRRWRFGLVRQVLCRNLDYADQRW